MNFKPKTFRVRCKHCGQIQLYQPRTKFFAGKKKECIKCGKRFVIHKDQKNTQIIKEVFWRNGKYE